MKTFFERIIKVSKNEGALLSSKDSHFSALPFPWAVISSKTNLTSAVPSYHLPVPSYHLPGPSYHLPGPSYPLAVPSYYTNGSVLECFKFSSLHVPFENWMAFTFLEIGWPLDYFRRYFQIVSVWAAVPFASTELFESWLLSFRLNISTIYSG